MFKHILIPSDGSELSNAAAQRGIALASEQQARVTAVYAAPRYQAQPYQEGASVGLITREQFEDLSRTQAAAALAPIEQLAKEHKVPFESHWTFTDHPYEVIVSVAQDRGCDLIFMASHGRRGLQALLLGSETSKVLTHCTIPVLVYR